MDGKKRQKFFPLDTIALKFPFSAEEHASVVGIVNKTAYDEDEDDEDESDDEEVKTPLEVPDGKLLVSMFDGTQSRLVDEEKVTLLDRTLSFGDIVKHTDKSFTSQSGRVVGVWLAVDVQHLVSRKIACGIDCRKFDFAHPITEDLFVYKDDWIGEIEEIWDHVILTFGDNSACIPYDNTELKPVLVIDDSSHFSVERFYPGQVLKPVSESNLRNGMWLAGEYKPEYSKISPSVMRVDAIKLRVNWVLYNSLKDGDEIETPPEVLEVKEVKVLNSSMEPFCYQISDKVKFLDSAMLGECFGLHSNSMELYPTLEIIKLKTLVTVHWQDGTIEKDIESIKLAPWQHADGQELWPNDYVVMGPDGVDCLNPAKDQIGIVTKVDSASRTASVRWFDSHLLPISTQPQEYSLYEIALHPDMQPQLADIVVITEDPLSHSNIVSFREDGLVEVHLLLTNRNVFLSPRRLVVYNEDDPMYADEEEDEEDEEDEDMSGEEEGEEVDVKRTVGGKVVVTYEDGEPGEDEGWETEDEEEFHDAVEKEKRVDKEKNEVEEVQQTMNGEYKAEEDNDTWASFKVCDVAPMSHSYYTTTTPLSRSLLKRIQKEHSILSTSLPPGILVRAFEDRMDLLRVLIVGPEGTPYDKGLFLFDLSFPSEYPTVAPNVFFHSWTFGMGRLNPNLYEVFAELFCTLPLEQIEGKVCLSLLGTWHGKDSEMWSALSNVLQVLVSIQGLVLNRDPYYNEAGYESKSAQKKALSTPFLRYHFYENKALERLCERCDGLETAEEGKPPQLADGGDKFPLVRVSAGCAKMLKGLKMKLRGLLA
ncbi:hypothetical protein BC829DRAFT_433906 [Chytridium lagenaria]|nr:hypothetical protein BC829DRAFT_433906 [Chytridium lagenaria]